MIKTNRKYKIAAEQLFPHMLFCTCGTKLFDFLKGGGGPTELLFFDQFAHEKELEAYQYDRANTDPDRVRLIICHGCHTLVGRPVKSKGRLAFKLRGDHLREVKLFS